MSIAITEEHAALAAAARRFLDNHCPPAVARAALEAEVGSLPPFWDEMAKLGWLGLHIDEADGGQGFGLAELAVVVPAPSGAGPRTRFPCRRPTPR